MKDELLMNEDASEKRMCLELGRRGRGRAMT